MVSQFGSLGYTITGKTAEAKLIQEFGWTSRGMDWGWVQGIKSTTHRRVKEFGYSCRQRRLTWAKEKKNWTVELNQKHQKLVKWPWCWCAWQASKENLWGIVERKMRNLKADDLKAAVKETWASIPPQQCHKLITSMPRRIEAVIKAKIAPTKYWVHIYSKWTYFPESQRFTKNVFYLLVLWSILISWDSELVGLC